MSILRLRHIWSWLMAEYRWRVLGKRYKVVLSEEVQNQLDDLPEETKEELMKAMEHLSRNPYSGERVDLEEEEEK